MHRPLLIAAFVFLLVSLPLSAQHGGGHASFGGRGGVSAHGGFSGHAGGTHASGGTRPGAGFASSGLRSHRSSGFRSSFRSSDFRRFHNSHDRFRDRDFGRDRFRRDCFGFGFGCNGFVYPWWYAGGFDPYWWGDSGSSYDQDQQDQIGLANDMNAQSLEEQRMREQDNQYAYQQSAPAPPRASRQVDPPEIDPNTVLVFRDGHKEEVQNYAIVGQTLWNFSAQHRQRILLSDLELQATARANEERGVDFHVPNLHEGQ